jgi:hypothetical protein
MSVQNVIEILMLITLNMYIAFGGMTIFTMLILPICEHRRSSHLLKSYLVSLVAYSFH